MAHLVEQRGQLITFDREGVFHFRRDLVIIRPGDQAIFFQEFQPIRKNGVADVFQIVLYQLEAIIAFFDTKQHISEPPFAYQV